MHFVSLFTLLIGWYQIEQRYRGILLTWQTKPWLAASPLIIYIQWNFTIEAAHAVHAKRCKNSLTLTRQWRQTFLIWDPVAQYPWSAPRARPRQSDGRDDVRWAPVTSVESSRRSGDLRDMGETSSRHSCRQQQPPKLEGNNSKIAHFSYSFYVAHRKF